MPIATNLFTIRREVRMRWSSFSLFMVQAPLQVINLLLHVFGILLMRDVAFTPRLTLIGVGSMYTFGLSFTQIHGNDLDVKTPWILLGLSLNLP